MGRTPSRPCLCSISQGKAALRKTLGEAEEEEEGLCFGAGQCFWLCLCSLCAGDYLMWS